MKNILSVIIVLVVILNMSSCKDLEFGNEFLGEAPEQSGATIDTMFSSRLNSEMVLANAYSFLPYGLLTGGSPGDKLGGDLIESLTDINHTFRDNVSSGPINLYYNGALSAQSEHIGQVYRLGGEGYYHAIRYAWLYIENIDRVSEMYDSEMLERKAEAKIIMAVAYSQILRNIGGVPWIDHATGVNEKMHFPRLSFKESVNRIVGLIDEAIPHLKWKQDVVNDGRMTKAGAMALKLRVLLFAASPTFNGAPWHAEADTLVCYGNYSKERWEDAKDAGKDFYDMLNRVGEYALTAPKSETHHERRMAFRSGYYDRGGTEVLISSRKGFDETVHNPYFGERYYMGPTLEYVNMFSFADGNEFPDDFNWSNPSTEPFYNNGVALRDPRLYETVAVPGELRYFNGAAAPVYSENPNFRIGASTGFMMMKFILNDWTDRAGRPTQWPILRLPEALLSYAEAINEANGGPNAIAYECVNKVRNRVGLPDLKEGLSQEAFRQAVLKERALELGFEEVRWYDMVRWGREDLFRKKLHRLEVHLKEGSVNEPKSFTYKVIPLNERHWQNNWDTKWFLSPIPQREVNKEYGLKQNPGW